MGSKEGSSLKSALNLPGTFYCNGQKYAYECSGYAFQNEVVLWDDRKDEEMKVVHCATPADAVLYLKKWLENAPKCVTCRLLKI